MSTSDQYWALPDGISEALPEEAARLEILRRRIIDLYASWGYQLVIPPMVEYLQSLTTGVGSNLDLQTFKVTDLQSGRMMGIRADMTPQIARIDAHKLQTEQPTRLCYIGTVLHTQAQKQGGSRSPLQVGAELFGHAGIASDIETLSLLLATLEHCQVPELTLDLGHVGIFRGLSRQAGLTPQQEQQFFAMLQRKSLPEIDGWLQQARLDTSTSDRLARLPQLYGPVSILEQARTDLAGAPEDVLDALDYLTELVDYLQATYPECRLHIDLTELSGYDYHTGIVYGAYCATTEQEIARGGRYDGIGKAFGRARPATGFSTDLRLLSHFASENMEPALQTVFAPAIADSELEKAISKLRHQGHCVIRQLGDQTAAQANCQQQLKLEDGHWNTETVKVE